MKELLSIGIIGTSSKENEKRVAIHPDHLIKIPLTIRKQLTFEKGYGVRFGMSDRTLAELTSGRVATREEIVTQYEAIIIPKPTASDLSQMKEGSIVWGWMHCVQQKNIAQIAIDKKLTLIAWEQMFEWDETEQKGTHIFYKNNEIAGYAAVNHALNLLGITGNYGNPLKAAILSFGSVGRGALKALQNQGISDISLYTRRNPATLQTQLPKLTCKQMIRNHTGKVFSVEPDGSKLPISQMFSNTDIIVNAIFQDITHPFLFISENEASQLKKNSLIIDISCDEGMGFWCAQTTTFTNPIIQIDTLHYYAIDHTPNYYWKTASWVISEALIAFLPVFIKGAEAWKQNKPLKNAVEINRGIVQNKQILLFQKRDPKYPHPYL